MKLLICDDEKIILEGLKKLDWASVGITAVRTAENGLMAIKTAMGFHPDLILTDIRMSGVDGLEVARQVHDAKLDCKIILLSGYGTFDYARSALKYGVCDYLLKPASPEEVLGAARRALSDKAKEKAEALLEDVAGLDVGEGQAREILEYIEENYMNWDISLTTLSDELHLSPAYISRLVKKATGYNFMRILALMRMLKAADLLSNTGLKTYVISKRVGINDPRYFSQLFKKTFGKTPGEFRRGLRTDGDVSILSFLGGGGDGKS